VLSDWNNLARLKPARSTADLQGLFYPSASADVLANLETKGSLRRRKGFLATCTDSTYHGIYATILKSPDLRFFDIQAFFRVGREHGKILSQVLTHVGQWLNPSVAPVGVRDANKPPLWMDFLPAFRDGDRDQPEERARSLQRQILVSLRDRVDELARGPASSYLSKLPDAQGDAYLERFSHAIWRDLLLVVHSAVGARFRGSLIRFNTQDPSNLPQQSQSTLMCSFRNSVCRVPEISSNPALRSSTALDALMVVVKAWAVEQNEKALRAQRLNQMPPWPSQAQEVVASQQNELSSSVSAAEPDNMSLPIGTPPPTGPSIVPGSVDSERYTGESAVEELADDCQAGSVGHSSSDDEEGGATQSRVD
jgi:hypothetical protein